MSFGAGHVQDMNNRIKQNRAQRPSNRGKFKENNRDAIYADSDNPEKPNFKTVPDEELNIIKMQIRDRAKKERKKMQVFYGASLALGLVFLVWFLIWIT